MTERRFQHATGFDDGTAYVVYFEDLPRPFAVMIPGMGSARELAGFPLRVAEGLVQRGEWVEVKPTP